MSQYTTGEMAKFCNVTVRTVQFYDTKDLLKPSELTEGGRRLYSDDDLEKLRLICLLKSLGLSLDAIKGILESESPEKFLLLLLGEQEKVIDTEISSRQKQLKAIRIVKDSIQDTDAIPVQAISDIENMMNSKNKLKNTHGIMLVVGIAMDVILIVAALLWVLRGYWLPFAIGLPAAVIMGVLMMRMYHKNTSYICAECNSVFHPSIWAMLFSRHTPKTRKLKCPNCQKIGFCVEVAKQH